MYELKTRSERRARITVGGITFRAKDVGSEGNSISIQILNGKFIATNFNTSSENVIGDVDVKILTQSLKFNESYTITHSARGYSISSQIADATTEVGDFRFNELFYVRSKLSVKLTPKPSNPTPTTPIRIVPRTIVIDLQPFLNPLTAVQGYDALDLKARLQESWVQVDDDKPMLSTFEEVYLRGGEGLPATPAGLEVSPTASLVVLNMTEDIDGNQVAVDQILQWDNGWVPY